MLTFWKMIIPQLFVSVICEDDKVYANFVISRGKKILKKFERAFEFDSLLLNFIKELNRVKYLYRSAILFTSKKQNLILNSEKIKENNASNDEKYELLDGNLSTKIIPLSNAFLCTEQSELDRLDKLFDEHGLDLVFSPFSLLYYLATKKVKNNEKTTLFVFKCSKIITLLVMKNGEIFGGKLSIKNDLPSNFKDRFIGENKETPSLEFSFDGQNIADEMSKELDFQRLGNDMLFSNLIVSLAKEIYSDKNYSGDFLEEIVLFNEEKTSDELLEMLRNEFLVDASAHKIDTFGLINELAREELEYDL